MEQVVTSLVDLTHLSWSKVRASSGTGGSFLKAQEETKEGRVYYKLSSYDSYLGTFGHESVYEAVVDRLLTILDVPHLSYRLLHADILLDEKKVRTWLCSSKSYRKRDEKKMALDDYYLANRQEGESPLDFCIRMGWSTYIYQMLVVDYLILNRDRHGANLEVLLDKQSGSVRLAPLFDHGVSLFCRCQSEADLEKEDVLSDKVVQCFVGSRSAWENLRIIPRDKHPSLRPLRESHREALLAGFEQALSERHLERIWEMIWRRWQAYEAFRDKG